MKEDSNIQLAVLCYFHVYSHDDGPSYVKVLQEIIFLCEFRRLTACWICRLYVHTRCPKKKLAIRINLIWEKSLQSKNNQAFQ